MWRVSLSLSLALLASGCGPVDEAPQLQERVAKLESRLDSLERDAALAERVTAMEARLSRRRVAAPARAREHPGRYGGEYRQGLGTEPPSLDPAHFTDTTSWRVALNVMEGLVELSPDMKLTGSLARSWEVTSGGTVFVFHLRDGVRFHNGRVCTAEDFVWSFRRMLEPKTASERAWLLEEVLGYRPFSALMKARGAAKRIADGQPAEPGQLEGAIRALREISSQELERAGVIRAAEVMQLAASAREALEKKTRDKALMDALDALNLSDFVSRGLSAPDALTLRIELARPFAPFLGLLTMPNLSVVPREEVERLGDEFARRPAGTGPFRFVRWEPHVTIELEAFEDYHRGRPYLDRLRFRMLPDPVARLYELEVGNLEQINEVPDEKYEGIKGNLGYPAVMEEVDTMSTYYLGFNTKRKPFDDVRVRRAFNHAIKKDVILDVIRRGRGRVARGPLPPGIPAFDPALEGYRHDPERALELLREAGYDDPAKLGEIEYWYNATSPNDPNAKLAEVIQQNLQEVGVRSKLQSTDWGTYLGKLDRGDAPMFRLGWVAVFPDPDNFLFPLFHSSMHGQSGNTTFYENPDVDALLVKARTTLDPAVRWPLYRQIERKLVEDAPWVFLFHSRAALLRRKNVRGLELTPVGPDSLRMRGVWLEK